MDGVRVMPWDGESPPTEERIVAAIRREGLTPHGWGNAPGDRYGWHEHAYHKVLYCVRGSIMFHTDDRDVPLRAGDRMDVPPHTRHAATVGPDGVRCVEAQASPGGPRD
jgi:quercetin dioxygenase-like cupin family protein